MTTWVMVAASPRPGKLRLPTCVDCIISPSGKVIFNSVSALHLLIIWTCGRMKWAVASESAMVSSFTANEMLARLLVTNYLLLTNCTEPTFLQVCEKVILLDKLLVSLTPRCSRPFFLAC